MVLCALLSARAHSDLNNVLHSSSKIKEISTAAKVCGSVKDILRNTVDGAFEMEAHALYCGVEIKENLSLVQQKGVMVGCK